MSSCNCACKLDKEGKEIVDLCGAHSEWVRKDRLRAKAEPIYLDTMTDQQLMSVLEPGYVEQAREEALKRFANAAKNKR